MSVLTFDWVNVSVDLPEMAKLAEENSPGTPPTEVDILEGLRLENVVCFTIKSDGHLVGYYILRARERVIEILDIQIKNNFFEKTVRVILRKLKTKLGRTKSTILYQVSEKHLKMHLVLRSEGFKAVKILHENDENFGDVYLFKYSEPLIQVSMDKGFMASIE